MAGLAAASVSQIGPASASDRRTVDRSFAVLATTLATSSNATGAALRHLVDDAPTLSRTSFFTQLGDLSATADADAEAFEAVTVPGPAHGVAAGCATAMDGRARALAELRATLEQLLGGRDGVGGGNEAAAALSVHDAGARLEAADASWAACRRALHRAPGSARLPVSAWVPAPGAWDTGAAAGFVAALVASPSLAIVRRLALVAIATDPSAVPDASGTAVVPPTSAVIVRVVVADEGDVDERGVTVVADVVPDTTHAAPGSVRVVSDVVAGGSVAVTLPPLRVRPGTSYVLRVTATSAAGTTSSSSLALAVSSVPTSTTTASPVGSEASGSDRG